MAVVTHFDSFLMDFFEPAHLILELLVFDPQKEEVVEWIP